MSLHVKEVRAGALEVMAICRTMAVDRNVPPENIVIMLLGLARSIGTKSLALQDTVPELRGVTNSMRKILASACREVAGDFEGKESPTDVN